MWIKICGNTNLEDAQHAAECGADAVGFVFAPSPRQVDPKRVRQITAHLPEKLEKYGVFVDATFDEILSTVDTSGLTGVQLHRTADRHLASRLQQHFAESVSILRVVHYREQDPAFADHLAALAQDKALQGVLVDSSNGKAAGGTGTSFNWLAARTTFAHAAPHLRVIAAGGLTPENVQEAIETLSPWGVDVVSGVETKPGKKDPERVKAFILAAQQAAEKLLIYSGPSRGNDLQTEGTASAVPLAGTTTEGFSP